MLVWSILTVWGNAIMHASMSDSASTYGWYHNIIGSIYYLYSTMLCLNTVTLLVWYIIYPLHFVWLVLQYDWSNISSRIYHIPWTWQIFVVETRCHIDLLTYMKLTNTLTTTANMYVRDLDIRSYKIYKIYTSRTLRDVYASI